MAQNDEQEIDLDVLQAQISMAMAEEEALVSSWVKPSKSPSKRPKRTFEEMEKELQDYMRRPPRLGVGAPIPDQVGPTAQEEAKLKYKLVGNDKKRKREEESEKKEEKYTDEDEEEGKKGESSSGPKVTRLDPFSLPKKKAKRKGNAKKEDPENANPYPVVNGISTETRSRELSPQALTAINGEVHRKGVEGTGSEPVRDASDKQAALLNGSSSELSPLTPVAGVALLDPTPKPSEAEQSGETKTAASHSEDSSPLTSPVSDRQITTNATHDTPQSAERAVDLPTSRTESTTKTTSPPVDTRSSSLQTPNQSQSQSLTTPVSPSSQSTFDHHLSKSARRRRNKKMKKMLALGQSVTSSSGLSRVVLNGVALSESDAPTVMVTVTESDVGTSMDRKRSDHLTNGISVEDGGVEGEGKEGRSEIGTSIPEGLDSDSIRPSERDVDNVDVGPQSMPNGVPSLTISNPLSTSQLPGGLPLLNLTGPPASDIDNEDTTQSPTSPSKKRRKHRKRNKNKGEKASTLSKGS